MYHIPQRRKLSKDSKWVTISDLKIQAVKEICYEVALNDFQHSRQEIEALAIVKMKELCSMYRKKDPNERDSWRAVARDVWDTVGVGDEKIEDVVPAGKGASDVDDLKVHVDKLEDILQEVKTQNNMKDEEIKALRNKMLKMEKVLPLMGTQGERRQRGSSAERDKGTESDKCKSFDPYKEGQVYEETDGSDAMFHKGRTQWMRQEQIKFKNLQQQEIAKQLRRNGPHRFIPPENRKPRFPFKSNPSHRSSWSPGTHIIITNDKCIEVKVPKEAEIKEQDEVEPEKQIWSPFSHLRNQHLTQQQQQYRGHGGNNNNNNDNTSGRWRSNSLNGYQKGLRRQASGSSESLQSSELKQTDSEYFQQQPPQGHQQRQQNWGNHYGDDNEGSNTSYNKQGDRPHYYNQFVTPPRMRRQYSAPNLKSGRETTV